PSWEAVFAQLVEVAGELAQQAVELALVGRVEAGKHGAELREHRRQHFLHEASASRRDADQYAAPILFTGATGDQSALDQRIGDAGHVGGALGGELAQLAWRRTAVGPAVQNHQGQKFTVIELVRLELEFQLLLDDAAEHQHQPAHPRFRRRHLRNDLANPADPFVHHHDAVCESGHFTDSYFTSELK